MHRVKGDSPPSKDDAQVCGGCVGGHGVRALGGTRAGRELWRALGPRGRPLGGSVLPRRSAPRGRRSLAVAERAAHGRRRVLLGARGPGVERGEERVAGRHRLGGGPRLAFDYWAIRKHPFPANYDWILADSEVLSLIQGGLVATDLTGVRAAVDALLPSTNLGNPGLA